MKFDWRSNSCYQWIDGKMHREPSGFYPCKASFRGHIGGIVPSVSRKIIGTKSWANAVVAGGPTDLYMVQLWRLLNPPDVLSKILRVKPNMNQDTPITPGGEP